MPRKSRYNLTSRVAEKEIMVNEKVYKTAVYARLSAEDSRKDDNATIDNQINLIENYIQNKTYLKLCGTYIDNGQTGTNFDREGFQNLMEEIKRGKIDCLIVKDLSRLGRDYIETGNYLEKVFPFLGVRFISVNDNYDSHNPMQNGDNLTIILKNFINDMYAKDISRKIKSVYETKQKKGQYMGNHAPYGYLKSPEDKHKLLIDEETAWIVRDIFQWKISGMGNMQIARKLNGLDISSPTNYKYTKGILSHSKYAKKILWNKTCVRTILSNSIYLGHMVQGKWKSDIAKGWAAKSQPEENWIIVNNTHEPIIDITEFEAANKITTGRKTKYHELQNNMDKSDNIFLGLVKCGDCNKNLFRREMTSHGKIYVYFFCSTYVAYLTAAGCSKKSMSEKTLKNVVFKILKQQIALVCDIENEVEKINNSPKIKNKEIELLTEYQKIEKNIILLSSRKNSLYDDFKDGLLTEKEYSDTRKKYDNDSNLFSNKLKEIPFYIFQVPSKFLLIY
jgi:DNA invertase Pin-like site-specific DNA recombinase